MNSRGRSSAAWWAEPQPVETGLSVDDRPNKLNIAFWVISSVGAESVVASHYLRVCACTLSLVHSLSLSLSFISRPPHKRIAISFSCSMCCILFSSLYFIPSQHGFFFSPSISPKLQFCPLVSLPLLSSRFLFNISLSLFSLGVSSLLPLSLSPSPLLFSLSLPPFVSLPPSLPQQLPVLFCLTLWAFFLSSYLSLWASLSVPSLSFSFPLSLPLISEPCVWSSIALCEPSATTHWATFQVI